jgi:hypothetical protein
MSMRSIFAQLLFVVVVAALFALPRTAQAHQGHAHATHAHANHTAAPAADAAQDLAESHVEQRLTAAVFSAPAPAHDIPCADPGCRTHGSCVACCSMVAPILPLILPPILHTEIDDVASSRHSGVDGPSLRRPPRSFA